MTPVLWLDPPILPPLPPPPARLIRTEGARRLRVLNVADPDPRRRRGFTDAVMLAQAPLKDGGVGILAAWAGIRQQGTDTSNGPRWGWVRCLPDRVRELPPWPLLGAAWYGWPEPHPIGEAIEQAGLMLPEGIRVSAVTPARVGPWLPRPLSA